MFTAKLMVSFFAVIALTEVPRVDVGDTVVSAARDQQPTTPAPREVTTVVAAEAEDHYPGAAAVPLYPIWEGTGRILPHRATVLSTSSVQVGLADTAELGVRPVPFFMRTPNLQAKVGIYRRNGVQAAISLSALVFMRGAAKAFYSSRYASRMPGKHPTVVAAPASLSVSVALTPWMHLHNTATLLMVAGPRPVRTEGTIGDFATLEIIGGRGVSLFFHAGEIGFYRHDHLVGGASCRVLWTPIEARVGYFYRVSNQGAQSQPLVSVGVLL